MKRRAAVSWTPSNWATGRTRFWRALSTLRCRMKKKSPISVWLLPAWLISNTFWTMSLSMSRLLTMFRNSFVMRRAGFRSREINYERSQNDWQKGKQTGLRNCAQPGNCPVQPAHETWPARSRCSQTTELRKAVLPKKFRTNPEPTGSKSPNTRTNPNEPSLLVKHSKTHVDRRKRPGKRISVSFHTISNPTKIHQL